MRPITNVRGLIESGNIAIALKQNNWKNIIKVLSKLTKNNKYLKNRKTLLWKWFWYKKISKLIDDIRNKILIDNNSLIIPKKYYIYKF